MSIKEMFFFFSNFSTYNNIFISISFYLKFKLFTFKFFIKYLYFISVLFQLND